MLHKIPGVFLEKNINRDIGCKKFQQCCNPSSLMVDQVEKVPLPVEAQGLRKKWDICTEWQEYVILI